MSSYRMHKKYLFAIATILATASLMITFATAAFAQIPTTSGTDPAENAGPGILPNGTVANITNSNASTGGY